MADLVLAIRCELSLPIAPYVFATDAQGAGEQHSSDNGGYGEVGAAVDAELLADAFECGTRPGFTVAKLNGDTSGLKRPDRELRAQQPVSCLPPRLLDQKLTWHPIASGRWAWRDHITLGEGRATLKLLARLAASPGAHAHCTISLEDNLAWGGAAAKGRSSARVVNRLCRKMAALCIGARIRAFLPWVDSPSMPADELSRRIVSSPP